MYTQIRQFDTYLRQVIEKGRRENVDLIVTTAFGLEAVVKRELEALGLKDIKVSNRK